MNDENYYKEYINKLIKKQKMTFIIGMIMLLLSSIVNAMAVSAYLYNSNEVSYNNNASGITSSNVQGAIDELYEHATDYTNMNTRVSALEGYFKNNPTSYFEGSALRVGINSSSNSSLILYKNGTKRLQLWPYESSDQAGIQAYASDGTNIGPLNLIGDPIRINGTSISGIKAPLEVFHFTNNTTFSIPLYATPSGSHYGSYLMINENGSGTQHIVALVKCGNNPTITNLISTSYTLTIAVDSNNVCTITSNNTVWGETVIMGIYR